MSEALYGVETVVLAHRPPSVDHTPTVEIMTDARAAAEARDDDPAYQPTLPPTVQHGTPVTGPPLGSGYVLDSLIGHGANGRVWRGIRRADGQPVAIKVLREEYAADPEAVARFLRERNALRAVVHPNLVRVLDLVVEGDTLAIVMELVDGLDLRGATRTQAFSPDRAVTVLAQVAGALATVHAAGIVHRDVKPENVLITWRGGEPWARLTDFGIAKVAGGEALTQQSQVVGTPAYLAPELAINRPPGPAVDVYALGVTAYELLAGHRPFGGEHPIAILRAHLEDEPTRPAGIADPVWAVVSACLAKEPADRPAAAELADAFTRLRGHTGALPAGAPAPLPVPMPVRPPVELPIAGPDPARPAAFADPGDPGRGDPGRGDPGRGDPGRDDPADGRSRQRARPAAPWIDVTPTDHRLTGRRGPGSSGAEAASQYTVDIMPTSGATVPVAEPPAPEPPKRRLLAPLLAALALLIVATGVGVWLGRPDSRSNGTPGDTGQSSSPVAAPPQLYPLAVTATSPQRGVVRLEYADASTIAGFDSYVIYRDQEQIAQVPKGPVAPHIVRGLDPGTEYCYRVWALVVTTVPPPSPEPKPPCLAASGGK